MRRASAAAASDRDVRARLLLVGFSPRAVSKLKILDVQRDELGATKRGGEAEQQRRSRCPASVAVSIGASTNSSSSSSSGAALRSSSCWPVPTWAAVKERGTSRQVARATGPGPCRSAGSRVLIVRVGDLGGREGEAPRHVEPDFAVWSDVCPGGPRSSKRDVPGHRCTGSPRAASESEDARLVFLSGRRRDRASPSENDAERCRLRPTSSNRAVPSALR